MDHLAQAFLTQKESNIVLPIAKCLWQWCETAKKTKNCIRNLMVATTILGTDLESGSSNSWVFMKEPSDSYYTQKNSLPLAWSRECYP